MLLVKVISTPYPPRKEPPENVMRGPGLLLQSYAEKSAEMATGIGRLVLLMWGTDYDDVAGPSDWHRTPGPACVGARGVPGEVGARMQSVHARGVEAGGKTLRCAHDKTVAYRQPRIFTSFWECYRRSLRSVFTYLSVTLAARTP